MLEVKNTRGILDQTARAARAAAPWVVAWALVLSGCQTTTTRTGPQLPTEPLITLNKNGNAAGDHAETKPKSPTIKSTPTEIGDATDPCPMQLQNMIGGLYEYYLVHRDLPERLEDLRPSPDQPFGLTCPATGRPYVYVRQGLLHPSGKLRLIIYDPTAAHLLTVKNNDGRPVRAAIRWGIVTTIPQPGVPIVMSVEHLTDAQFHAYAPGATEVVTPPATGDAVPLGNR